MEFTIGTDPEGFLSIGDKFVSAFNLFPGTKGDPYPVENGAIQVDGLALEFNINPAKTREEFNFNIESVLSQMHDMIRQVDPRMKLNFVPIARFDKKEFDLLPEEAKLLGCDPDFNSKGEVNKSPEHLINTPLRTASGHIHAGWTNVDDPFSHEHMGDCLSVINFFKGKEFSELTYEERERLQYYGGDEAFRPKPYGIEMRKFSNLWVAKKETRLRMFDFIHNNLIEMTEN